MSDKKTPNLHRDWIDPDAIEIVQILQRKGFTTYLVGGCVRDLLVGIHPKDYDIATTAHPKDVKRLIYNSYIIGKRFRLVLVRRGDRQFEVATFRKSVDPEESAEEGQPFGDNVFGTPHEDAARRDFTINSLFYDPIKNELIDYNTGLVDIEERTIRMIGDAGERLVEDPIRILRALRLAHKLGFGLDVEIRSAICRTAETIPNSVLPRRREEILKILKLRYPGLALREAYDLNILKYLSPTLHEIYDDPEKAETFCCHLQRAADIPWNLDSPVDLFSMLILAYTRTIFPDETYLQINANRFLEDPKHGDFLRNQLGLFKYEQGQVARALQICHTLEKTKEFQRKGERRQMALLKNDSFPLALKMAQHDLLISPAELLFWSELYQKVLPQLQSLPTDRRPRRPRRGQKKGQGDFRPGPKPQT